MDFFEIKMQKGELRLKSLLLIYTLLDYMTWKMGPFPQSPSFEFDQHALMEEQMSDE